MKIIECEDVLKIYVHQYEWRETIGKLFYSKIKQVPHINRIDYYEVSSMYRPMFIDLQYYPFTEIEVLKADSELKEFNRILDFDL